MVNFTFVSQHDSDGRSHRLSNKKACDSCRSKKRRCHHQSPARSLTAALSEENTHRFKRARLDHTESGKTRLHNEQINQDLPAPGVEAGTFRQLQLNPNKVSKGLPSQDMQDDENQEIENEPGPQFVGDLNPAARLLDGTQSPTEHHDSSPYEVGVWVQPRSYSNVSRSVSSHQLPSTAPKQPTRQLLPPASDMVSDKDLTALSDLYFTNVHPILPLLNEQEYRDSLGQRKIPKALVHAVCLVAAKDPAAGPHLWLLQPPAAALSVKEFCAKLYVSVKTAITRTSAFRRITLVRILGLLSLHQEGSEGAEEASLHLAMACHHAQSLAMHLHRPGDNDKLEMKKTFWCLWTLDRLNAATNSRPCVFNDIDIAIDDLKPGELGSTAFDIWFKIAKILSRAIALYRPTHQDTITGIELGYSSFEQLVDEVQGWHLPPPTLATLRIFFLATAILAYRLKTITTLPTTTVPRLRQQLSAMQIIRQMQDPRRLELLHPLPVIVYGASLALSVSYQQMRYSKLAMDQEEALHDFKASCNILQILQRKWCAADAMASLAQKVSIELEKVPNLSFLHVETRHLQNGGNDRPDEDRCSVGPLVSRQEHQQVEESNNALRSEDLGFSWDSEVHDLFGGMDDMSWMYLALTENPIRFEDLPELEVGAASSDQPML